MYFAVYNDDKDLCLVALDQSFNINKDIFPILIPLDYDFTSNLAIYYEKHVGADENKIQIITYDFIKIYDSISGCLDCRFDLFFNRRFIELYSVCHFISRGSKMMHEYNRIRPPKTLGLMFNYFAVKRRGDIKDDLKKTTYYIAKCYKQALVQ